MQEYGEGVHLDRLLSLLEEITGISGIAPEMVIGEIDIDSLDLLEWAFALEEELGIELQDAILPDSVVDGTATVQELYDAFVAALALHDPEMTQ